MADPVVRLAASWDPGLRTLIGTATTLRMAARSGCAMAASGE
jgi:hypothetical protein